MQYSRLNIGRIGGDTGTTGRLSNIDKLKAVCAFLVVCIHAPFNGEYEQYFVVLTRIAVPIFFMLSGFFYNRAVASRQIKKLLLLLVSANTIYLVWKLGIAIAKDELSLWIGKTFTIKNIAKFLILNDNPIQSHLWYLGAALYVTFIITVMSRFLGDDKCKTLLYIVTPILLIGDLVLGKYSLLIFHRELPYIIVRNWLFVGIPYFTIGIWIQDHIKHILRLRYWMLVAIIMIASLTTILEKYLLVLNNADAARDHYLSTTILAISVFLLFLLYVNTEDNCISRIGRNDSTWVYILHPIVIPLFDALVRNCGIDKIYDYTRPFIIYIVTIVIVELMRCSKNKILKRVNKND